MSDEEKELITVDGVEYELDSFSNTARHYLRQIQSLSQQTAELQNKIQQCEVARVGFVRMLKEDLTAEEEPEESDE
jgi:prefoldin subunit 5